jgi:WD40 repeat protein
MAEADQLPPPYPVNTSFVSVSFSPNGARLALGTSDRGVMVVDAFKPRKEFALLSAHPCMASHPCGVAWAPDSSALAVGGADGHAWVYDVSDGPGGLPRIPDELASYDWHPALVRAPDVALAGEAAKTPAARAAALAGARAYRDALHGAMNEKRVNFCRQHAKSLAQLGPPLPPLPFVPPPAAADADEMAARHDAPVCAIAWHPRAPVLATAARSVALWGMPGELPASIAGLVGAALDAEGDDAGDMPTL